jgi:hypothetical protein
MAEEKHPLKFKFGIKGLPCVVTVGTPKAAVDPSTDKGEKPKNEKEN